MLKDIVDKYGQEFQIDMEKTRDMKFIDAAKYILKQYNLLDDINEAEESGLHIIQLLKDIYSFGFYDGVDFNDSYKGNKDSQNFF